MDQPGVVLSREAQNQCDPQALSLWNELGENQPRTKVDELFAALLLILKEDFPTFCALLLRVRPKGGGMVVPLVFNQVQQRMWREICNRITAGEPPWFVVLKFRQAGMSTFWCAWIFWQIWRQRDVQTMAIAHQNSTAETMIEFMRVFYDELPQAFRPMLRKGNPHQKVPRSEVYFDDLRTSCIIHLSKNVDPRGQQVTHVIETEFASYDNPSQLNGALLPQLPTFGSEARLRSTVVIESTPKGQNAFYDMYHGAKKGKQGSFHSLFFPWFLFDEQYSAVAPSSFRLTEEEGKELKRLTRLRMHEYSTEDGGGKPVTRDQMYWRRETIATDCDGDADVFDQEYPSDDQTCFLLASKSVFRQYARYLDDCVSEAGERARTAWNQVKVNNKDVTTNGPVRVILKPVIENRGHWTPISSVKFEIHPHGKWLVWEPPRDGHKYAVGADPAMGLEDGDNSAICVVDVTDCRQVAEFADTMPPERFAYEIAAAGYWYNQALCNPEINNVGYVVLNRLIKHITYPNLYKWPKFDEVNRYTNKRGWETNTRTKQLLVSSMINYVDEQLLSIASRELLGEMSTYERKSEGDIWTFDAQKGRHDDRVMAFGLAIMAIDQTPMLVTELNRGQSKLPSARDLHLAGTVDVAPTALPQAIAKLIEIKHAMPWNPMSSSDMF